MVVDELFVKLGVQVDSSTFAAANRGLELTTSAAQGLVVQTNAVGTAAAAMATEVVDAAQKAAAALQGVGRSVQEIELPAAAEGGLELESTRVGTQTDLDAAARRKGGGPRVPKPPAPPAPPPPPGGFFSRVKEAFAGVTNLANAARAGAVAFAGMWAVQRVQAFTREMVGLNDVIERTKEFTGLSAAAVQELGFAADSTGADLTILQAGLKTLTVNSAQAFNGAKSDAAAFEALGITVKDAAGNLKSTEQLLAESADAIAGLGSDGERTAAAVQLFGQAGVKLVPLLKQGAGGIAELRAEAQRLGAGLSEEALADIKAYDDQIKRLDFALVGFKGTIANLVLPVLTKLADAFTKIIAVFKDVASNTYFLESALGVALFASLVKIIPLIQTLTVANLRAALSAALAAAPYVLWAIALLAFSAAVDEIINLLKGNETVVGKWLDEWLGIGTVDDLVTSWAAGIDSLKTAFLGLGETAQNTWKILKGIFTLDKDLIIEGATKQGNRILGLKDDLVQAGKAYVQSVTGETPEPVNLATGQGVNAGAISNASIPRAVAASLQSGRALGSAGFGQASRSHLNPNVPPAINTVTNMHFTTGANPAEIKHVVSTELGKQNKRVKAALVPKQRPAKAGAP